MNCKRYTVHSMTGFARRESRADWGSLSVELRSLNQRFLEIHPRLPENLRELEPEVRRAVHQRLARGKVEVSLRFVPASEQGQAPLHLNETLARSLLDALPRLHAMAPDLNAPGMGDLLRFPGLFQPEPPAMDRVLAEARALLDEAVESLLQARADEGSRLAELIAERLEQVRRLEAEVRQRLPEIRRQLRERLERKLAEWRSDALSAERLEQEFVLQAMKLDVDEELDRLILHVQAMSDLLQQQGPVGRKMDFLAQEMNREANTLGAKSVDQRVSTIAVELKVLIEQIREQVQNIE